MQGKCGCCQVQKICPQQYASRGMNLINGYKYVSQTLHLNCHRAKEI